MSKETQSVVAMKVQQLITDDETQDNIEYYNELLIEKFHIESSDEHSNSVKKELKNYIDNLFEEID